MTTNKTRWLLVGLVCLALWPARAPAQGGLWETYMTGGAKAYQQGNDPEAKKQLVAALKEAEGFGRPSMAVLAVEDGWHWPGSGRCLQCWWRKGSFWAYRSLAPESG